jgi:hypothetical protein
MSSQWSQLNQCSLALYTKHLPTYMCRHPTWGHPRLASIGLHISPSTQILVYNCNTYMIPQLIDQSCETLINLIDWSIMFQFHQFGQLIKLVKLTKLIKLKHGWSNLVAQSFQTLIKFGWSLNHVKLWSNLVDQLIMPKFVQGQLTRVSTLLHLPSGFIPHVASCDLLGKHSIPNISHL